MRILIIEDDEAIRGMMGKILKAEGYDVMESENGKEGIKLFKSDPNIDLVITDIIMPEKEGIETILEMRSENPDVKILAISGGGKGDAQDYLTIAKSIGANDTLKKPFMRNDLLEAVQSLIMPG